MSQQAPPRAKPSPLGAPPVPPRHSGRRFSSGAEYVTDSDAETMPGYRSDSEISPSVPKYQKKKKSKKDIEKYLKIREKGWNRPVSGLRPRKPTPDISKTGGYGTPPEIDWSRLKVYLPPRQMAMIRKWNHAKSLKRKHAKN